MSILEPGAMARTTQDFHKDNYSYGKGVEFEVETHVTAEEASEAFGYYLGNRNGGYGNIDVREDHVELVRSAKNMSERKLPTPAQIAEHLASEALSNGDDMELDEADWSAKDGTFDIYGTTPEGLRFAATVRVLSVEGADF